MVGKEMPGSIERVACEPYDYTIENTGEVIKMGYRWDYQPEGNRRFSAVRNKTAEHAKSEEEKMNEEYDKATSGT